MYQWTQNCKHNKMFIEEHHKGWFVIFSLCWNEVYTLHLLELLCFLSCFTCSMSCPELCNECLFFSNLAKSIKILGTIFFLMCTCANHSLRKCKCVYISSVKPQENEKSLCALCCKKVTICRFVFEALILLKQLPNWQHLVPYLAISHTLFTGHVCKQIQIKLVLRYV